MKRAFKALNAHGEGSKQLKEELEPYDGGKETLFLGQHRKCAYCDRRAGLEGNHVEHFRPKREAWRHLPDDKPRIVDPVGYWWLTWTWSNHLFVCASCNTGFKKNHFPLAAGSPSLSGPKAPYPHADLQPQHENVAIESALLVDPSVEDPLDHIEWRLVNPTEPRSLWKWNPAGLTPSGEATIKVLGLVALAYDVGAHVRDNLMARANEVCDLVDGGQPVIALQRWLALGKDVAGSHSTFAGPTWNALHVLVDAPRRAAASLPDLPRP